MAGVILHTMVLCVVALNDFFGISGEGTRESRGSCKAARGAYESRNVSAAHISLLEGLLSTNAGCSLAFRILL